MQHLLEQNSRTRNKLVKNMENFSLNSAKSYLGKNVNLHLKDGAVIINVQLTKLRKGAFGKGNLVEYVAYGSQKGKADCMPLRNIAWAEMLNLNLMAQTAG
jgi:hypothetical protein